MITYATDSISHTQAEAEETESFPLDEKENGVVEEDFGLTSNPTDTTKTEEEAEEEISFKEEKKQELLQEEPIEEEQVLVSVPEKVSHSDTKEEVLPRVTTIQKNASNFTELKNAIATSPTGNTWLNIRIRNNIVMTGTITLPVNTTITIIADGTNRTLSRGNGFTGTFFNVPNGAALQLNYAESIDGILTLNGGADSGIKATGPLIKNSGKLLVQPRVNLTKNAITGSGGALLNETTGKAYFKSGMSYNSATGNGGAVFNRGYYEQNLNVLNINGNLQVVTGHNNDTGNTAGQSGGWAYNAATGTMVLNEGKYYSNRASSHGGLIFNNGKVTINDGVYYQNSTSGNGSIVYQLDSNASVTQTGGHVYNNTTGNFAYYIQAGMAYIKDNARVGLSTSETTSNNNGNLYLASGATGYLQATTSSSNVTLRKSDGLNVFNLGTLYMQNSGGAASTYPKIDGASSGLQGIYNQNGSIYMFGGTITANQIGIQMFGGSLSMPGGYIQANSGNGVNFGASSSVTVSGGVIQNNNYGIYNGSYSSGTISATGGKVTSNRQAGIYNQGITTVNGGEISYNGTYGILNRNTVTIHSGIISNNTYSGIINDGSGKTTTMYGGFISSNQGAGIDNPQGTVNLSGGIIERNQASGIQNRSGTVTMRSGTIRNNTAPTNGGGIDNYGTFTMSGGEISGNSTEFGGGVFNHGTSARFTLDGGTITGNTAISGGAGVYNSYGTVSMESGTISDNKATGSNGIGGGIVNSSGTLDILSGTISNNTAKYNGGGIHNSGAGSVLQFENGTIRDNDAGSHGGGIYNSGSNCVVSIRQGTIQGNYAGNYGGGINNSGASSSVTMTGGTITGNTSTNGGGIHSSGDFTLSGGTIQGNTGTYGAGVYQNGMFYLKDAARIDVNNDVYLPSASRVLTVIDALTTSSGSIAKITPNSYSNGRPVVTVSYSGANASTEYAYPNTSQKFLLTPNGSYCLRPGNKLDAGANVSGMDIVISSAYTITYNQNSSNAVSGMPGSQTKYWYEAVNLSGMRPTQAGFHFMEWNTSSSGSGTDYQPSERFTSNANTILYAQWNQNAVPEYRVSYDANGGSGAPADQIKKKGESLTLSTMEPTRIGYTFLNWNTEANGTGTTYSTGGIYTADADVTLYAQWKEDPEPSIFYTVRYDANGGVGAPDSQVKARGVPLTLSTQKPTKDGYTFIKWNTSKDGNGVSYLPGGLYSSDQDVVLYAQWQKNDTGPITYKVRYDANGGANAPGEQIKIHGLDVSLSAKVPTRSGYLFICWNTKANGTGDSYAPNELYKKDADVTLYAQWRADGYTISYRGNGATGGSTPSSYHRVGVESTLTPNGYYRTGYWFLKWNTATNGTGDSYYDKDSVLDLGSNGETIVLHAIWNPITYFIVYDGNGATGGSTAMSIHIYDEEKALNKNGYTKDGAKFLYWSTKPDGSGKRYEDGEVVMNLTTVRKEQIKLYAIWSQKEYKISYDANGGSGAPAAQTKIHDTNTNLSSVKPTWLGRQFLNWNTKPDGSGVTYYSGAVYTENADATLYAQWRPNGYTINYEGNGKTGGFVLNSSHTVGVPKKLSKNNFYKTGYTFVNWNTNADGSGTSYENEEEVVDLTMEQGAIIDLYVQWKPITYTVRYDGNGATGGSTANSSHTYDVEQKLTTNGYTKKNSEFIGWNTKPDGSGTSYQNQETVKNLAIVDGAIITLYAQWKEQSAPEIEATDMLTFYEGEKVTKEMLLSGVKAMGSDGKDLTDQIRITKIAYSEGKLVNGEAQPAYEETWETDMPKDALLDTWFLQMEKDSVVTHEITYEVTDSTGATASLTWKVKVIYNQFPEITNEKVLYFSLEEAQAGEIQENVLLSHATAKDYEDNEVFGLGENLNEALILIGFDPDELKAFTTVGYVRAWYQVTDSLGKITLSEVFIVVHTDGEKVEIPAVKDVRFIHKGYYEAEQEHGGLHPDSIWKKDAAYQSLLEGAFAATKPKEQWQFTFDDVSEVKAFVRTHGIGNSQKENGLATFWETFQKCKLKS